MGFSKIIKSWALLTFLFIVSCPSAVFAGTIHVPADEPTIQAGIDAAEDGDIVLVADDTYTGDGNKNLDFGGRAITVKSENGPENCTIDCENDGRGFYFHNNEGKDSVVSGFTITNGYIKDIGYGGAIYNFSSSPTITNCTFLGNHAYFAGGGAIYNDSSSSPVITNCILWADSPGEIYNSGDCDPIVTFSDIEGGYTGEGNIDADPLFVDPITGNFHLQPGSPCIDTGTNDAPELPDTDFEGDPRIVDGDLDGIATVDMGADEYSFPCECDLNHDGSCNIMDWPYFTEDWGRSDCNDPGVNCECDLNGDGNCNILDWPYFIEDWGRTDCPTP